MLQYMCIKKIELQDQTNDVDKKELLVLPTYLELNLSFRNELDGLSTVFGNL